METMKICRTPSPLNIQIDNIGVKQVAVFKYLGSILIENGSLDRMISAEDGCVLLSIVFPQVVCHPLLCRGDWSSSLRSKARCVASAVLCLSLFRMFLTFSIHLFRGLPLALYPISFGYMSVRATFRNAFS